MLLKNKRRLGKLRGRASKRHPPPPIDEFAEDLAAGLAEKFSSDVIAKAARSCTTSERARPDGAPAADRSLASAG